GQRREP
ncbi:hypothetical protein EC34870_1329B, partial [Escherichia coli 3.4870]